MVKVISIKVIIKVSYICLYLEVTEKVKQVDLYISNLLAFLEDLEVKAIAKYIKIIEKLNTIIKVINITKVARKLNLQNSKVLNLQAKALEVGQVPLVVSSLGKLVKRLHKKNLFLAY